MSSSTWWTSPSNGRAKTSKPSGPTHTTRAFIGSSTSTVTVSSELSLESHCGSCTGAGLPFASTGFAVTFNLLIVPKSDRHLHILLIKLLCRFILDSPDIELNLNTFRLCLKALVPRFAQRTVNLARSPIQAQGVSLPHKHFYRGDQRIIVGRCDCRHNDSSTWFVSDSATWRSIACLMDEPRHAATVN